MTSGQVLAQLVFLAGAALIWGAYYLSVPWGHRVMGLPDEEATEEEVARSIRSSRALPTPFVVGAALAPLGFWISPWMSVPIALVAAIATRAVWRANTPASLMNDK